MAFMMSCFHPPKTIQDDYHTSHDAMACTANRLQIYAARHPCCDVFRANVACMLQAAGQHYIWHSVL